MSTTLHLPYKRFVRQVSNGSARSKYAYQAMMRENALALQTAQWREATCADNEVGLTVNAVAATDGEFDAATNTWARQPSYKQYMKDRYDAFKQGGDAVPALATMCGYAGMAAYRFTLPESSAAVALESVKLLVARDRYCLSGVRVAVVLNNESVPGAWCTWDLVRGNGTGAIVSPSTAGDSGNVASWGFMGQSAVPFLTASRAEEGALELKATTFPALAQTGKAYLWVFVSIEDYADWWAMFDSKTARYYSIEGSAMLMGGNCEFVFASTVTGDISYWSKSEDFSTMGAFHPSDFLPDESGGSSSRTQADAVALRDRVYSVFGEKFVSLCSYESIATVPGSGNASEDVGRLLGYDKLPTASYLSKGAGGYAVMASLPMQDIGKFSLNKFAVDIIQVGTSSDYAFIHSGGDSSPNAFGALLDVHETSWAIDTSASPPTVAAANYSRLKMVSAALIVPAGCQEYHGIYIQATKNTVGNYADWDFGGVNFWLVDSASLMGVWRHVAIGALLSQRDMFAIGAETVTASVEGDGSFTTGITVSATARKIGYVPFSSFTNASLSSREVRCHSDLAIRPGSTVLVCPCLAPALTGVGYAGETGTISSYQAHFEITTPIFYPGEVTI